MTAYVLPNGKQQYFSNAGVPLVGGKLYTYDAGTLNPRTTWSDAAQLAPNANPITLDARGEATVFWSGNYKINLTDSVGGAITGYPVDNVQMPTSFPDTQLRTDLASAVAGADGSRLIGFRRSEAGATARTANQKLNERLSPLDFGAVLDGVTDDSTAIQNWANAGGKLTWPANKIAKLVTLPINLGSNTAIEFEVGGGITTPTPNLSVFKANAKTNVHITGGIFTQTGAGATGDIGVIDFETCTWCSVYGAEIVGAQWAGVRINSCTDVDAMFNYFHGTTTNTNPAGDANDIAIYRNSVNCRAGFNRCYTANNFGIICQDPGGLGTFLPQKNKIHNNWVRSKTAHGIIIYIGAATTADSYNEVFENDVQDVSGSAGTTIFGAGIYVVGFGACGTKVIGNNVRNCCSATTALTNNQAGITINGLPAAGQPVVCSNNTISGMTKYSAMNITANLGCQVICENNGVDHPAGNTTGDAIRTQDSLNTSISGNVITVSTASGRRGVLLVASVPVTGVQICNNRIIGGGDRQIESSVTSTLTRVRVSGNQCSGAAAAVIPIYLATIDELEASGNECNATGTYAMFVSSCTRARVNNNVLRTTGTLSFGSTGVCTGSYFGESNYISNVIENSATGLIANQFASAAPIAPSIGAVGDRVIQSVPVVGNPKGWRCTVAGTPGTWVSEGVL